MSNPANLHSFDEDYQYEKSFKQPPSIDRVLLHDESETPFIEEQTFDQSWIWTLMGVLTAGAFISMIISGLWGWMMLIAGAGLVASMSILSSFKLYTRIDDKGIHFRTNPFFGKIKTIEWTDVDQVYVRRYSPIMEYGGWGIRLGRRGWAYTARGNQGIQIVRKNGRRILLGTQKSDEVAQKLDHRTITV